MAKDTLILTFSQEEKGLTLRIERNVDHSRCKRLPLPWGEGWGEGTLMGYSDRRLQRKFRI